MTPKHYNRSRLLKQAESDGRGKLSEDIDFSESSQEELMGHVLRAQEGKRAQVL
jgi:hypothetical protein